MTDVPLTKSDAEALVKRAEAARHPETDLVDQLTVCALDFGFFNRVMAVYDTILQDPGSSDEIRYATLFGYTAVLTGMRDHEGALQMVRQALQVRPKSPNAWINVSRMLRILGDGERAILAAENAFAVRPNSTTFVEVSRSYTLANRGQDLRAKYTPADVPNTDPIAFATALFDLGAFEDAEAAFDGQASFLSPDFIRQNTHSCGDLAQIYPDLDGAWPEHKDRPVYFMACDQRYFDIYAAAFAKSVGRLGDRRALHVHVYDPTRPLTDLKATLKDAAGLKGISITAEQIPKPDRIYYSSARFLRFSQLLSEHQAPAASLDADSLVVQDVFHPTEADIVGFQRPEFPTARERFYAAFLRAQPTADARHFLDMLASFIAMAFHHKRARWYVDQMGLLVTHKVLVEQDKSVIWQNLTHSQIQYQHLKNDALVWAGKGLGKEFPSLPDIDPV